MSQRNPFRIFKYCFFKSALILTSHLRLGLPSSSFCHLFIFLFSPKVSHIPFHLLVIDLLNLTILSKKANYHAHHYGVFSTLLNFIPIISKRSSQYPVLDHSESVFFPLIWGGDVCPRIEQQVELLLFCTF